MKQIKTKFLQRLLNKLMDKSPTMADAEKFPDCRCSEYKILICNINNATTMEEVRIYIGEFLDKSLLPAEGKEER